MKSKSSSSSPVIIPYKDTPEVKQKLLMLAAQQGHGKVMWVVRAAVTEYIRRHEKKLAAG
jgi:predicted transcriptional regulator